AGMVDIPWAYEPDDENAPHRGVLPYPTLSIEQAMDLDVASILHDDCVVGMWVTNFVLVNGFYRPVLRSWRFSRVGEGGGSCRSDISVSASFVWRCLSGSTVARFPHPAHRTGHADLPHPALGQDLTPSPTARHAQARSDVRARSGRKGARVDRSRPCVA